MKLHALILALLAALLLLSCGGGSGSSAPVDGTARSADGVPIHYHAEGSGAPALLFVHGWSCDGSYWVDQLPYFAKSHRVVTVDLAGHGESGAGRTDWTMKAFGADVKAVMDELDLKDVVLIGHSMGGAVIVEAALAMPNRVRGLVGVDNFHTPAMTLTQDQIDRFIGAFQNDYSTFTDGWVRSMFPENADPHLVSTVAEDMAAAPPDVAVGAMSRLLPWFTGEAEGALGKLPVPIRCINSDKTVTEVDALSAIVDGYEVRLMPGYGHFLFRENPSMFNKLLEETVESFPRAPGM